MPLISRLRMLSDVRANQDLFFLVRAILLVAYPKRLFWISLTA
jgi:hypothetical protein